MRSQPLPVRTCTNIRDLGGYETTRGTTHTHRFLRCGSTSGASERDLAFLRTYGVARVIDLRGAIESPALTCRFATQDWVTWRNIELYDVDISASSRIPTYDTDNYLVSSYAHMLSTPKPIREVFEFCAQAQPSECVLFHCAAGMDRTGMVAMLLLGLVGVTREQIIADYAYSFGEPDEVDAAVAAGGVSQAKGFAAHILNVRLDAIATVYDTLVREYGSVENFLLLCGIRTTTLDAVRDHLLS